MCHFTFHCLHKFSLYWCRLSLLANVHHPFGPFEPLEAYSLSLSLSCSLLRELYEWHLVAIVHSLLPAFDLPVVLTCVGFILTQVVVDLHDWMILAVSRFVVLNLVNLQEGHRCKALVQVSFFLSHPGMCIDIAAVCKLSDEALDLWQF